MIRFSLLLATAATLSAGTCESLSTLSLPQTTMTMASAVPAGPFESGRFKTELPAFCRVGLTIKPTSDSNIKVEVWLPAAGWNGKYQGVGNPGWAGAVVYADLAQGLRRGYAVASTDSGHDTGSTGAFALGHPEKLVDFGYRSVHEMTLKAKAIVAAYYGDVPKRSYFTGCSSGGRMGMMEAQRYPDDYDGIVSGAPTNNWTNMMFGRIWISQAANASAASVIPPAKYPALHAAVLNACDANDGVHDGVIDDPGTCRFDPATIQCKGPDSDSCLTAPQLEAFRKIYSPAKNSRTGEVIFPGLEPGSESGLSTLAGPRPISLADDHFKYVVFQNPAWDYKTLNFDTDISKALTLDGGILSAVSTNMKAFWDRGGKMIQYHGWADQQAPPRNSPNFYNRVLDSVPDRGKVADSYRLFMVPGMGHCGGGDGPASFDMLSALEKWVEKSSAPTQIPAAHLTNGKADRTRILCPHPQVAKYKGSGSPDDAANFSCTVP